MHACPQTARARPAYIPREPTRTPLYALVSEHHATFRAVASDAGGVPSFVNDAFERFLRCGVLSHGFARFVCTSCEYEHFVGLSCNAPAPTQREVEELVLDVHKRVMKLLAKLGLLEMSADDPLAQDAAALSTCYEGAVTQRVGLGPTRDGL